MSGPLTSNRQLAIPTQGSNVDTWGTDASYSLNANSTIIDQLFGGVTTIDMSSGNVTISTSQSQYAVLWLTGTISANRTITFPQIEAFYLVFNNCITAAGTDRCVILSTGAGNVIATPLGTNMLVHSRGASGFNFADNSQWAPGDYKDVGYSVANAMPAWVTNCTVAPWLLCNGQAVSRTVYAQLFGRISTSFGSGNGSTTFNVPDLRFRVRVPPDNMGGSAAGRSSGATFSSGSANVVGSAGGEAAHVLSTGELAQHSHGVSDPGHVHDVTTAANGSGTTAVFGSTPGASPGTAVGAAKNHSTGISINNTGSNTAHNTMQPFQISGQVWIKT